MNMLAEGSTSAKSIFEEKLDSLSNSINNVDQTELNIRNCFDKLLGEEPSLLILAIADGSTLKAPMPLAAMPYMVQLDKLLTDLSDSIARLSITTQRIQPLVEKS